MRTKFEEMVSIIRQEEIADDIYSMWLKTERVAAYAKAGQFVSVYSNDGSRLLPRPISICEIDKGGRTFRKRFYQERQKSIFNRRRYRHPTYAAVGEGIGL